MLLSCRWLLCLLGLMCGLSGVAKALDASSFYSNFANTTFVDQHQKIFKPEQLIGKVVLFNFVYTKCSNICPTQTKQLVEIYQALPSHYQNKIAFITVSLDSQYDKPSVLRQYAKQHKANYQHWQFLSGSYDDIKALQEKLYLFGNPANPAHPKVDIAQLKTKLKEDVLKNHMTVLWVVDKRGLLIQRYAAVPMDQPRVERELKQISDI